MNGAGDKRPPFQELLVGDSDSRRHQDGQRGGAKVGQRWWLL